ncbi:unnamed protein product [Somion occarium]|uniref:DUF6534 domain-containing protein n=1 Tax=Somion occarium TaxID=3059160 RepID=A0ABP1D760_9APHY
MAAAPEPTVDGLLGGLVICFCFVFMLYGVTVTQSYVYMLNCKDDPKWMKLLVATVLILESLHSAFAMRFLYYSVIIAFGSVELVGQIDWSLGPVILLENAIVAAVEGFFIRRMWIRKFKESETAFNANRCAHSCHTTAAVFALTSGTWADFQAAPGPNITVEVSNALSAAVDAIIATSMIYYLHRGQSGQARTDGVVKWLMSYAINSGAMMMIVSLAIAITYVKVKESLLFLGLVMIVSKLYANSLLGTLNARQLLRSKTARAAGVGGSSRSNAYELSKIQVTSSGQMRPIEIYREKTQVTDAVAPFEDDELSQGKQPSLNPV